MNFFSRLEFRAKESLLRTVPGVRRSCSPPGCASHQILASREHIGSIETIAKYEDFAPSETAMACGQSACKSTCYKEEEDADHHLENGIISGCTTTHTDGDYTVICSKCKEREAVIPHNNHLYHDRLCLECFRSSLYGKFKLSVTSHSIISPYDKVLVAFSGGPASRFPFALTRLCLSDAMLTCHSALERPLLVSIGLTALH